MHVCYGFAHGCWCEQAGCLLSAPDSELILPFILLSSPVLQGKKDREREQEDKSVTHWCCNDTCMACGCKALSPHFHTGEGTLWENKDHCAGQTVVAPDATLGRPNEDLTKDGG